MKVHEKSEARQQTSVVGYIEMTTFTGRPYKAIK